MDGKIQKINQTKKSSLLNQRKINSAQQRGNRLNVNKKKNEINEEK